MADPTKNNANESYQNESNKGEGYETTRNKGTRMEASAQGEEGVDQQREGGKYKGQKNKHTQSNHQEGMYDKQSDNPTMQPSGDDGM
jgi:hypothetical protein